MSLKNKIIEADNRKEDNGFFWKKDVAEAVKELKENCIKKIAFYNEESEELALKKVDEIFGEFEK